MKTKRTLIIPLLALVLLSCAPSNPSNSSSEIKPSETTNTSDILTSDSIESSSSSSEEKTSNESSEQTSQSETSTSEDIYTSEDETSSEEETNEDPIPSQKENLPIGNTSVSGPKNLANPVDITDYTEFDLKSYLPDNFSYIQGNNKINHCSDFYAESSGGGFKFSHLYYGFQTSLFNSWNKIEVRLTISQVHNSSKQANKNKPPFMHVYGYNKKGEFVHQTNIEQGKLTANTKEIKFYIENQPDVQYLEFRLNEYPFKGSQCYNFGVSQLMLRGWPRV